MFSHLPQLNSIRVFDSAARLKSFKEAALELNVTPTAVSHQIRALEERLGTLLFERRVRYILLTAEGEKLAHAAHQSLQQISNVMDDILNEKATLNVSTTASFAAQWLVPKLDAFQLKHPDIQVVIKTDEKAQDLDSDRRIDVAIRYGEFDKKNEYATKLVTERFGMFASRECIKRFPSIEKANLIETQWKNTHLREITWSHYFKDKNGTCPDLNIRSYDQEHHAIQAALVGQGVVLVSRLLVETALKQGWLEMHPEGKDLDGLTYYILTKSSPEISHKVALFRQWLVEELEE